MYTVHVAMIDFAVINWFEICTSPPGQRLVNVDIDILRLGVWNVRRCYSLGPPVTKFETNWPFFLPIIVRNMRILSSMKTIEIARSDEEVFYCVLIVAFGMLTRDIQLTIGCLAPFGGRLLMY